MKNTNDITQSFGTLYHPKSALVFYETKGRNNDVYVEHFDMDKNGNPINAHPLTQREAKVLARALQMEKDKDQAFLKSNGILPTNILHINPNKDKGAVLWYTKAKRRQLYFVDGLDIPNGMAHVPPMIWHAKKTALRYLHLQMSEDLPRKHHYILHHFSTSMKMVKYVWVLSISILKTPLR